MRPFPIFGGPMCAALLVLASGTGAVSTGASRAGSAGLSPGHVSRVADERPHSTAIRRAAPPESLVLLSDSLAPLIADFNAAASRTRFIAVLSPVCPACVHGALAIKEALMADTAASSPIYIVWTPMVAGDDRAAALKASKVLRSRRVRQYYDPDHAVGALLRRDVFPNAVRDMQSSVSSDHFIFNSLRHRSPDDPEWDIYMFFDPGVLWKDAVPRPSRWVRQLARFAEPGSDLMSLMWVNSYAEPPVEGDLGAEISVLATPDEPGGHQ